MTDPRRQRRLLAAGGLALVTLVFFSDYLLTGALPATSAEPARIYHNHVEAGRWLRDGVLPLWRPGAGVGASTFSTDASLTVFHLSAVLFALVPSPEIALVLWVALQVVLVVGGTTWFLVRRLRTPPVIALMGAAVFVFTPGFHNEYLFNTFGGYGLLPLQICLVDRLRAGGTRRDLVWLALLLLFAYLISNIAVVQFCAVFLGCYLLYVEGPGWRGRALSDALRPFLGLAGGVALFLACAGFYLVPFVIELATTERSHTYGFFTSLTALPWLFSLHLPFTSWIFIDEQMFTTGLLTRLETLPRYSHLLFLPSFLLYLAHRRAFSRAESFFFLFAAAFVVLSVINRWVPVLDLVVWITRGTGWHRAVPLYFFSGAVCVAVVCGKLASGVLGESSPVGTLVRKGMWWHWRVLLAGYAVAATATVGMVVAIAGFEWNGVYRVLGLVTDRPRTHLEFYLDHYLTFPQVAYVVTVPILLALSVWAFGRLRPGGGAAVTAMLVVGVVGSQVGLARLYYPFNRGAEMPREFPATVWLGDSMPDRRTAIVFNEPVNIELDLMRRYGLPPNHSNPELHVLSRRFPEFSRFQSDITMQGSFFNAVGAAIYTRGANMCSPRLDRFHQAVLEENAFLQAVWESGKGYLRIGRSEVNTPLLDVAGVTHLLSSVPLEGTGLRLEARGEAYYLYQNVGAAPRFMFTSDVEAVVDGAAAFDAIRSERFDPQRTAVVEVAGSSSSSTPQHGSVSLVSYRPNEVVVDVEAPASGVLVYNDAFHAGWSASVAGTERPIVRTNYLFKGVALDAGQHRVRFTYRPPGLGVGLMLSVAGAVIGLMLLTVGRRRIG